MASVVGGFPRPLPAGRSTYPWDEWLDGRVHRLEPGVDFVVAVKSMQVAACMAARRRGGHIRSQQHEGALFVQFVAGGDVS